MRHRSTRSAALSAFGLALLTGAVLASQAGSASPQATRLVRSLRGGTLYVNVSNNNYSAFGSFGSLDPGLAYDTLSWSLLYTTQLLLMNHPEENGQAGGRLYPEAAAAFPTVSGKGTVYTFRIRPGLRFSDGSPVTAASYRRAWERSLSPKMTTDSGGPPVAVNDQLQNVIVGGQAFLAGKTQHLAGITAKRLTLVFRLTHADGAFLSYLAMPWFGAVKPNTPYSASGLTVYPSAGPYYIQSFDGQSSLVEVRNPYYRGPRPANPDRIVWTLNTDQTRSLLQVEAGQADIDAAGPPTSSNADLGRRYGVNKGRFFVGPTTCEYYLALNASRAPFSNAKYRKAVNWAIDRHALALLSTYGFERTDHLLVPGMPGYRPFNVYPIKGANPAMARKVAGGTIPGTVVVMHGLSPLSTTVAQIVEYNLEQIGAQIKDEPTGNLYQVLRQKGAAWDVAPVGVCADYLDPYNIVNELVDGRAIGQPGSFLSNSQLGYFNSPAVNRQLDAAAALSGAARDNAYAALDREIMTKYAPLAPWGIRTTAFLVSTRVRNWVYSTYFGFPDWNALSVR